jgi:NitT/TauT family transport system substrate-binding protein
MPTLDTPYYEGRSSMIRTLARTLAAAFLAAFVSHSAAQAPTKMVFLYTAVPSFLGAFVAKDEGFFQKRNLDVDLSMSTTGSTIPAALVSNSAQVGGPTPTVLLQATEGGLDIVVIAGCDVYPTSSRSGVLARPGSNIRGAQDLAGKKVGVPGINGIIDVLTRKWIQSNGLDYRKVTFVEFAFPTMGDALKNGIVDAVSLVDPFYSRLADSKVGTPIGDYGAIVPAGTMPIVYAADRSWVKSHPNEVKAFRDALDEAVAFINNPANVAKVKASLARWTKLPPQIADTLAIPANLTNRVRPEALAFWIALSREQGMIKGNPSPASLIAP